jgi:hypothetical protein
MSTIAKKQARYQVQPRGQGHFVVFDRLRWRPVGDSNTAEIAAVLCAEFNRQWALKSGSADAPALDDSRQPRRT